MPPVHPDLEVLYFTVNVEGRDPVKVDVLGKEDILFQIPESSTYSMTVHFKVKNRALNKLGYKQVVKRHGITIRARDLEIGDFEPSEDTVYEKSFPEDTTPGGFLVRGVYNATSTYYAGEEELMVVPWSLEITKK